MQAADTGGRTRLDPEQWERQALFERFRKFAEPYHGVCLRVDCTEAFDYAKDQHLSLFLTLLHCSLSAVQEVPNLRCVIAEDAVWRYDRIDGGSAIGRPNGTIGFGHYTYRENVNDFVGEAALVLDRVRGRLDLETPPAPNLVRYSTLPWFDFTSISHARNLAVESSSPMITFGKITEAQGRRTMPISIHVHHGLVDGSHVADFMQLFQQNLSTPG